jgi:hypothetical protein
MNCLTLFHTSPSLSLLHQEPPNPKTAIVFIYNKSPNFCLRMCDHQLTHIDVNPANHMPIR